MSIDYGQLAGLLASAALFGAMLFFSAVVAPLVFLRLEPATAGRFIRALFPWYYLVVIGLSAVAAAALMASRPVDAAIMALVLAGGVIARQWLMPAINAHRDRMLQGEAGAGAAFTRLHRASVAINAAQILAVLAVLLRLGSGGG